MLRSAIAVVVLVAIGLIGFFYVKDQRNVPPSDKARAAVTSAGQVVVEEGVALGVRGQLVAALGREATRFLHVYNQDGHILIYGLLGPSPSIEVLEAEARKVPGVKDVQVLVIARPETLSPPAEEAAPTDPARP